MGYRDLIKTASPEAQATLEMPDQESPVPQPTWEQIKDFILEAIEAKTKAYKLAEAEAVIEKLTLESAETAKWVECLEETNAQLTKALDEQSKEHTRFKLAMQQK